MTQADKLRRIEVERGSIADRFERESREWHDSLRTPERPKPWPWVVDVVVFMVFVVLFFVGLLNEDE